MAQATFDEYLKSVYYNPKCPGSFGGVENLYCDVKQEGTFKLSRKKISDWLMVKIPTLYINLLVETVKEIVLLCTNNGKWI